MSASLPPLPDQDARDRAASELDTCAFIEAGAGTGKSTTLVTRIINTITGNPAVPITRIAAITFTDRAGAELRGRLRKGLEDRLKDGADSRIAEALADLDAASVGTIHSLAQRILRTHALSAGLPLGFAPATGVEAADDKRLRTRAVIEHWEEQLDPAVRATMNVYGVEPYDLLKLMSALDDAWLRLTPAAFAPGAGVDLVQECTLTADRLAFYLHEAQESCADPADKLLMVLQERIPPVIAVLRTADPAVLAAEAVANPGTHPVFKLGNVGSGKSWTGGTPKEWRDRLKELGPELTGCLMAPLETAIRAALAQAWTVLDDARRQSAHEGRVTFDDLLSMTRDLLASDAEVRAQVHDEFQVVLVDEFQDTDPVQWEIIQLITSEPTDPDHAPLPGRLIVVGDPKQAIYSFRGADIQTYTDALEEFRRSENPLGSVHSLTTNFRSVEPVILWVNAAFSAGMRGDEFQVEYADLEVRHRPQHPKPGPAVTVVRDPAPEVDPADPDAVIAVRSTELEPRLIAQEIARAVRDGWQANEPTDDDGREYRYAAKFSDVAILYPARTGVPALLDALDDAGVPYRSGDAGLVFQRPAVLGLLAAIAVIDDADRQLDLWMALKSPLFGCDDADLLRHRRAGGYWRITVDSDVTGRVADAMGVLKSIRRGDDSPQPVAVIDALLRRSRLMEALAFTPRGAFDADCVRMLRAHAQQWQDDGGVGLADYLVATTEVQSDSARAGLAEPDDREDNAVRLMTVHQAKGLEFPIVVLAGMASSIYDPSPTVGVVDPGRFEFSVNKDLRSVGFNEWDAEVRQARSDAERMRLHYVACTRARDHLIISICGEHGKGRRPHSSLLWDAIPAMPDDVTSLDTDSPPAVPLAQVTPPPLPDGWSTTVDTIRDVSREPFVAAPSGAAAAALGIATASRPTVEPVEPPHLDTEASSSADARAARDGRPLGRAVHGAMDAIVRIGSTATPEQIAEACDTAAADEDITSQVDEVRRRVDHALATELMQEALAASRRWSELYLAAPVAEGAVRLVEGFADLVFESADGIVLVDYKTDEVLSPETLQHYADQLGAYARLLELSSRRDVVRRVILHLGRAGAETLG